MQAHAVLGAFWFLLARTSQTAATTTTTTTPSSSSSYSTNFSTIEPAFWEYSATCFDCHASKDPDECTAMETAAVRPGSINSELKTGLTITTSRRPASESSCTPATGGHSGFIQFKQPLNFGTIRVKARYFPGAADLVRSAKGFIGLESPSSGAITITMHGAGASASGQPPGTNWTRYMQSSCYRHGDSHNKEFTALGEDVNVATDFNLYEVEWTPTSATIKVNNKTVRHGREPDPAAAPDGPAPRPQHCLLPDGGQFELCLVHRRIPFRAGNY